MERQFNHSLHPIAPTSMDDANCGTYYPIQHNKYYVIFLRYMIEKRWDPFLFLSTILTCYITNLTLFINILISKRSKIMSTKITSTEIMSNTDNATSSTPGFGMIATNYSDIPKTPTSSES